MSIEFKEWDTEILGVKCGCVEFPAFPMKHNYDFLHARVPVDCRENLREFRHRGFRIVGVHQELSRDLERFPPETSPAVMPQNVCRYAGEKDADRMGELARRLFEHDRMHADPCVPDYVADYYKSAWGRNACLGYADKTLLMPDIWGIVGFVAVRKNDLYFIGVRKDRQRKGIGRALVELACKIIRDAGYGVVRTATQGGNVAALNMYTKANFVLGKASIDMHWVRNENNVFHNPARI
jgi:ribosomal protein S18 acetylase RimI-like enzyme